MPDNFVGTFPISIMGATNPTLGAGGQGVCGVSLHIDHEYIGDLEITLTAPNGSSVTLVGPIGFFDATDDTEWDIDFTRCSQPTDPDGGFSDAFNTDQPWGINGNYTGTYHPFSGCLEGLTGPVNGLWSINVTDGQAMDVGNFIDYTITFCDPTGITCVSCDANAGNLTQLDMIKCAGSPDLALSLPPTYNAPNSMPDPSEYSYTYVVSGPGGVIIAYEDGPDLSAYPPGMYTICGLSYLTASQGDLPAPGSTTSTALQLDLFSTTPSFCGKTTTNCVNITINPAPPDLQETATICEPECYDFYGQNICESGNYEIELVQNGCIYTSTLDLTVIPLVQEMVFEEICPDDCSTTPGFEDFCLEGVYEEYVTVAGQSCPKLVTLDLRVPSLNASIQDPGIFQCSSTSMVLNGSASTIDPSITVTWTASNGGTIIPPNNTANINISSGGTYTLTLCKNLSGGGTCCVSESVTVAEENVLPPAPASITGDVQVCQGETLTYSAAAVADATAYSWTFPAGVTVVSGQNTRDITVVWNSTSGGTVCASAVTPCGTSAARCINVSVQQLPSIGTITGVSPVCQGEIASYTVPAVTGATSYQWVLPSPATVVSGGTTNQIMVNWGNSSGGNLCVSAVTGCGNTVQSCLPVVANTIPTANAGTNGAVCGLSYSLAATSSIAGSTGVWSQASGPGSATFSNANAASTNVTVSTNGQYVFRWIESNGSCKDTATVSVNFNASPQVGQTSSTCDAVNVNYTVSFPISGGLMPYTATGGTVTGGVYTSSPIPSGTTYSVAVTDANGCTAPLVTGSFNCSCTTNAGTMSLAPLSACMGQTVQGIFNNDAVTDANDIGIYILHELPGKPTGQIYAQNTTGNFGFQAGMTYGTTYYISYAVGNNVNGMPSDTDPCFSVAQGQPVVFYENPMVNAGADMSTCLLNQTLNASSSMGFGTWTTITAPSGGTLNFDNNQSANTAVTANLAGLYTVRWSVNNNGCMGSDEVNLNFHPSPMTGLVTQVCDAANENYTVSFPINSGIAPYTVTGGSVQAGVFTSNPILSGTNYTFSVTDANGCTASAITGSYNCDCTTQAGTMSLTPLNACEGQTLQAIHNNDDVADGNDIGAYILHELPGKPTGQIYAQNTTGNFGFQTGMTFGTTYYISYVMGNNVGGMPSETDPCFSVAQGQPVIFHQNPVVNAGTDLQTCSNNLSLSASSGQTMGEWTISTSPTGGTLTFTNDQSATTTVSTNIPGTYIVRWTSDNNGCTDSDEVSLNFSDAPSGSQVQETCSATNENYTVGFSITGGTAPYTVGGTSVSGTTFTSNPILSNQTYSFVVTDANGCSSEAIAGAKNCLCTTNAGTMASNVIRVCEGTSITAVHNGDEVLDGNDNFEYILHNSAVNAVGMQVFARNKTGTFDFQPGMVYGVTYYVSYVVGNNLAGNVDLTDGCLSVASGQPVVFVQNPTPNAGDDNMVCGLMYGLSASSGSGTWTNVSGPGNAIFGNATNANTVATVSAHGTYQFQWETTTPEGCKGTDLVSIGFNNEPMAGTLSSVCDPNNTSYTVSFTITGGTSPYTVNGQGINGSVFMSNAINNNAPFSYTVEDANGCTSPTISGSENCNCYTNAGQMNLATIAVCGENTPILAEHSGQLLDSTDIGVYVLYSGTNTSIDSVIDQNQSGQFQFLTNNMQFGKTYHIAYMVGNNVGGMPDVNDPCFAITPGQPVVWQNSVSATVLPTAETCNSTFYGSTLDFSQLITDGDDTGIWTGPSGLGSGNFPMLDFNGTTPGMYVFTYITSAAQAPCENQNYSVSVTVNNCQCPPVGLNAPAPLCNDGSVLDLTDLLQPTTSPGTWSLGQMPAGNNPATLQGTSLTYNNADAGVYELIFTLTDTPPSGCLSENTVEVQVSASVNAGTASQTSLCEGEVQTIQLADLLTGADNGGSWEEISAFPSTSGAFSAANGTFSTQGQTVGTYRFRYILNAVQPCQNQEAVVSVTINPTPAADAGLDQILDCNQISTEIGNISSQINPNISIVWQKNGVLLPGKDTPQLTVSEPGIYTLTLIDPNNGCSDSDQATVVSLSDIPVMDEVMVNEIRCFGENDGAIKVNHVSGGLAPYQYSLNGGTFNANGSFINLLPGNYLLEMVDSKGCAAAPLDIVITSPEEVSVSLGDDLVVSVGDSVKIQALFSIDEAAIDTIIWSPLILGEFEGKDYQWAKPLTSKIYQVTVVDTNGCKDSDDILIRVDKTRHVYIPNVINVGGTENNLITVFGGQDVEIVERFEIYDRWGGRVFGAYDFQPNDPTNGWDGTFRGKMLTPSVLVYFAEIKFLDGERIIYTGDITIKR